MFFFLVDRCDDEAQHYTKMGLQMGNGKRISGWSDNWCFWECKTEEGALHQPMELGDLIIVDEHIPEDYNVNNAHQENLQLEIPPLGDLTVVDEHIPDDYNGNNAHQENLQLDTSPTSPLEPIAALGLDSIEQAHFIIVDKHTSEGNDINGALQEYLQLDIEPTSCGADIDGTGFDKVRSKLFEEHLSDSDRGKNIYFLLCFK